MVARHPWLSTVAVCAFVLGTAQKGRAEWQYRLSAASLTGVARNSTTLSGDTTTSTAGFETGRGSIQLINIGQFVQSHMSYSIGATTWFGESRGLSLSHTLGLGSTVQAHPTLSISLAGTATLTQMTMLDASASTDPQALGLRPSGNNEFLTVQVGEAVSWSPSPSWSVSESLDGRLYRPLTDSQTSGTNKSLTLGVQVSHMWTRDTASLRGQLGQVWQGSAAGTDTQPPDSQLADVGLAWTHVWSQEWTHDVGAGVSAIRARGRTSTAPSVSAGVLWQGLGKSAALRVGQRVDSNVYVGTTYNRRFASLRLQISLDRWETLRAAADGGVEQVWTSATLDGTEASANAYSARFGLYWQPIPMLNLGLDYSFREQRPSASGSGPSPFPSVRRQTAMFTVEVRYPSQF